MKIPAIQSYSFNQITKLRSTKASDSVAGASTADNPYSFPPPEYYVSTISFGIANSGKLRTLFSYGLPCMYTGVNMIDPKKVYKLVKSGALRKTAREVIGAMKPFEDQIVDIEKRVYNIIKEETALKPQLNFQEILRSIAPVYQKRLRKKQAEIFKKLKEEAQELPAGYDYKFKQFMIDTDARLNDKAVFVPFSSFEFKYKLEKIKEDVHKRGGFKEQKVMSKLIKEAEKLTPNTTSKTEDYQKNIINFLGIILKTSVLKNDTQLNTLLAAAKARLNHEKIKIPFSRKTFIYDLTKLLEKLPDKELKERLLMTAGKLPTSRESVSAYILKFMTESPEKIAFRLLWPTFASVEHILPKSCGGADAMSNFGGATTRVNADRGNNSFTIQLKKCPQTRRNSQKYVDRLIELAKNGVFDKNKIDKKYIEDFKETVKKQSAGAIVLNTSALYE